MCFKRHFRIDLIQVHHHCTCQQCFHCVSTTSYKVWCLNVSIELNLFSLTFNIRCHYFISSSFLLSSIIFSKTSQGFIRSWTFLIYFDQPFFFASEFHFEGGGGAYSFWSAGLLICMNFNFGHNF